MIVIDHNTGQAVWRPMPKNWTRRRSAFTPARERCINCNEPFTPKTTKGKIQCACDLKREDF